VCIIRASFSPYLFLAVHTAFYSDKRVQTVGLHGLATESKRLGLSLSNAIDILGLKRRQLIIEIDVLFRLALAAGRLFWICEPTCLVQHPTFRYLVSEVESALPDQNLIIWMAVMAQWATAGEGVAQCISQVLTCHRG